MDHEVWRLCRTGLQHNLDQPVNGSQWESSDTNKTYKVPVPHVFDLPTALIRQKHGLLAHEMLTLFEYRDHQQIDIVQQGLTLYNQVALRLALPLQHYQAPEMTCTHSTATLDCKIDTCYGMGEAGNPCSNRFREVEFSPDYVADPVCLTVQAESRHPDAACTLIGLCVRRSRLPKFLLTPQRTRVLSVSTL